MFIWIKIITSLAVLTAVTQAAPNLREEVEAMLPEIKNRITQKYPDLQSEQIKLFSIQYNYADSEISKIFQESSAIFKEQTRILFVTNEKPTVNEKNEKKELVVEGVIVTLETDNKVKDIEKGFHLRDAYKKRDGTYGDYSSIGFTPERYYRISQQGGVPARPFNHQPDPESIKINWEKTNKDLQAKVEKGDPESQYRLAMNMILGNGFEKNKENLQTAKLLLQKASANGYDHSKIQIAEAIIQRQSATNPQQNP